LELAEPRRIVSEWTSTRTFGQQTVVVELHSHANERIVWMLTAYERGLPVEVELLLMAYEIAAITRITATTAAATDPALHPRSAGPSV
jgi:hypothetical protein